MAVYCWGGSVNGELGLGGIEEEHIRTPRELRLPANNDLSVKQIACGEYHTVFLLDDGTVYSCGRNDVGQLGHTKPCKRPERLDNGLNNSIVVQIASGSLHSLAVDEWGALYSWGDNTFGQLGRRSLHEHNSNVEALTDVISISVPRLVKALATKHVVQVACGSDHCLAILDNGSVYSWGKNDYGQLGRGTKTESQHSPSVISALTNVPIALVACGGHHSFAVTCLGAVYGWGRNTFGQLGVNDDRDRVTPTDLTALRSQRVRYVSCGENHTAALTHDGGVYTWGAGTYGQLGHGSNNHEILPRKVLELMGSTVTQIACGKRHTLVYDPRRCRVYAFGQGGSGQLGVKNSTTNLTIPFAVEGPWTYVLRTQATNINEDTSTSPSDATSSLIVRRVFGGGDRSFVIVALDGAPDDLCKFSSEGQILKMELQMAEKCSAILPEELTPQDMIEYVETVFGSPACISASFISHDFSAATFDNPYVNMDAINDFFEKICQVKKVSLIELILECLVSEMIPSLTTMPIDWEALRVYLVIYKCCFFFNKSMRLDPGVLCTPMGKAILALVAESRDVLDRWWTILDPRDFQRLIAVYKKYLVGTLSEMIKGRQFERWGNTSMNRRQEQSNQFTNGEAMLVATRILERLNTANNNHGQPLPYEEFYIPELTDVMDVRVDYIHWLNAASTATFRTSGGIGNQIFLCDFPFLFDARAKTLILQTDAILQMQDAMDEANRRTLTSLFLPIDPASAYLVLFVSRDTLVQDTLSQLTHIDARDLKKPLKVVFSGEDAVDAGGVRKEFFMLLLKEVIDPKYGMFKFYPETLSIWFNEKTFETEDMFYLIGLLCGLAIYNGNIINLPFPLALYRKLLGEKVRLEDLRGLSPTLHRSLQHLLEFEGADVQETFGLTFEVNLDAFGEVETRELVPGGSSMHVTADNKSDYVDRYVNFLLNEVVDKQYAAFHAGFHKVCGGRVLQLFHAQELMAMIVGNEHYDWFELEKNAEYKGVFSASHPTIKMLWEIFHSLSLEHKKKFLLFLTGYDRIPIFGMKSVKLVIQSTGGGEDFLPVAHTCFNLLDLPIYNDKETLRWKLLLAIEHTQGFALA